MDKLQRQIINDLKSEDARSKTFQKKIRKLLLTFFGSSEIIYSSRIERDFIECIEKLGPEKNCVFLGEELESSKKLLDFSSKINFSSKIKNFNPKHDFNNLENAVTYSHIKDFSKVRKGGKAQEQCYSMIFHILCITQKKYAQKYDRENGLKGLQMNSEKLAGVISLTKILNNHHTFFENSKPITNILIIHENSKIYESQLITLIKNAQTMGIRINSFCASDSISKLQNLLKTSKGILILYSDKLDKNEGFKGILSGWLHSEEVCPVCYVDFTKNKKHLLKKQNIAEIAADDISNGISFLIVQAMKRAKKIEESTEKLKRKIRWSFVFFTILLAITTLLWPIHSNEKKDRQNSFFIDEVSSETKINNNLIVTSAKVFTVDNFQPVKDSIDKNEALLKFGRTAYFRELCSIDYNTYNQMKKSNHPVDNPSFLRVKTFLDDVRMKKHFVEQSRKEIYYRETFRDIFDEIETTTMLFPNKKQKALTVLTLEIKDTSEIESVEIKLGDYIGVTNDFFIIALNDSSKGMLKVKTVNNSIKVCMFEGESLIIKMIDGSYFSLKVEDIINPIPQREGDDYVKLGFEYNPM